MNKTTPIKKRQIRKKESCPICYSRAYFNLIHGGDWRQPTTLQCSECDGWVTYADISYYKKMKRQRPMATNSKASEMTAKKSSTCKYCHGDINVGDKIKGRLGLGYWHQPCPKKEKDLVGR